MATEYPDFEQPKILGKSEARLALRANLNEPHIAPLTAFVEMIRKETNRGLHVPYFDPSDGGVKASCLCLLEAPGPRAVASGFISRNNPDETAKNMLMLCREAGLRRELTVLWNIVPWYIGADGCIRAATQDDIDQGLVYLDRLLPILRNLRIVVLIGKKAQKAAPYFSQKHPALKVVCIPHPSPQCLNPSPANRQAILIGLREIAATLERKGVAYGAE